MTRRAHGTGTRFAFSAAALVAFALAAGVCFPARAGDERPAAATEVPRHHRQRGRGVDERVELLAKALELDASQRTAVKRLLLSQREQVLAVWSDASVPPPQRVIATRAIGDRTMDQIGALLNAEQRKKFTAPRVHGPATPGPSVEDWMRVSTPR